MNEITTCGKGLAAHAALPAQLGELLASLAENLEAHLPSIDVSDANGKRERAAYVSLAAQYRDIAQRLQAAAIEMAGCRELPMASHHEAELAAPRSLSAFREFVEVQHETLELLQQMATSDQQLLDGLA